MMYRSTTSLDVQAVTGDIQGTPSQKDQAEATQRVGRRVTRSKSKDKSIIRSRSASASGSTRKSKSEQAKNLEQLVKAREAQQRTEEKQKEQELLLLAKESRENRRLKRQILKDREENKYIPQADLVKKNLFGTKGTASGVTATTDPTHEKEIGTVRLVTPGEGTLHVDEDTQQLNLHVSPSPQIGYNLQPTAPESYEKLVDRLSQDLQDYKNTEYLDLSLLEGKRSKAATEQLNRKIDAAKAELNKEGSLELEDSLEDSISCAQRPNTRPSSPSLTQDLSTHFGTLAADSLNSQSGYATILSQTRDQSLPQLEITRLDSGQSPESLSGLTCHIDRPEGAGYLSQSTPVEDLSVFQ